MRRVDRVLSSALGESIPGVHGGRLRAVYWAVDGVVSGGRLGITSIGRNARSASSLKHAIKRADRLVGNERLFRDHRLFFAQLAKAIVGDEPRVVVLVDWTKVGLDHYALAAAVPHDGRAVPIYFEVHPTKTHGTPAVEEAFLDGLACVLPSGCRPILVTDGGFRGDWILAAKERGMDYVARMQNNPQVLVGSNECWSTVQHLTRSATSEATDLGECLAVKTRRIGTRIVRGPRYKPSGRRRRKTPLSGSQTKARKAAKQAWLLATSLDNSASAVVGVYALRMQIEEVFRDAKSHRFGLALRYARASSITRYSNLLLLAILAVFALVVAGRITERHQLHLGFQANTTRRRRVLSLAYAARILLRSSHHHRVNSRSIRRELRRLRAKARAGVPN